MYLSELVCLALAVYHEARGEPLRAQAAVAQVVLERVERRQWPDTACGVVTQGGPAWGALPESYACQLSFYCDGKPDTPYESGAWHVALAIALAVELGWRQPALRGATHYHADYVSPRWASALEYVGTYGRHLFYR